MSSMIKNIIFDLGNVLLKGNSSDILDKLEINANDKKIIKKNFFDNSDETNLGQISLKEHFNKCNLLVDLSDEIKNKIINYYLYREYNYDLFRLILKLKKNNYKVFILSNNNLGTYEYIKKSFMFESIDGFIMSCEYGKLKPDKEIFEVLFSKYDIPLYECYFIDDNIDNINTALNLGMKAFNYKNNYNDLLVDLKNNNIKY